MKLRFNRNSLAIALLLISGLFFGFRWYLDLAAQSRIQQPPSYEFKVNEKTNGLIELPPVFADPDSLCWYVYASILVAGETWHLRESPIGNAPDNRPMMWSHLYLWWIAAIGAIKALITGQTWSSSIASAIFWANPISFVLFSVLWVEIIRRVAGLWPAAIGLLMLCSFPGILLAFGAWHPDHHGFHAAAALGSLTCAVLGTKELLMGNQARANKLLMFAGAAGGVGLWVGATQQVTVIAQIGAVALAGSIFLPREELDHWSVAWMKWAAAGTVTGFAALLLEFLPNLSEARLETNHPFYLATWLGGGLAVWAVAGLRLRRAYSTLMLIAALALLPVLPLGILFAGPEQYSLRDPIVLRCHEFIAEFLPARLFYTRLAALREFAIAVVVLPAAFWALWVHRKEKAQAWPIGMALIPICSYSLLILLQRRWGEFLQVSLVVAGVLLAGNERFRRISYLIAAISLAGMTCDLVSGVRELRSEKLRDDLQSAVRARDIAVVCRLHNGGSEINVLADDALAPALYACAGIRTVGALYWENASGIRDSAICLASHDDAEALRIIRARRITHIIVEASPRLAIQTTRIARGTLDPEVGNKSLAWRLARPEPLPPPWLTLQVEQTFLGSEYPTRIYKVTPE